MLCERKCVKVNAFHYDYDMHVMKWWIDDHVLVYISKQAPWYYDMMMEKCCTMIFMACL